MRRDPLRDHRTAAEVRHYDGLVLGGEVVLDLGAHVGLSVLRFLSKGALRVIAVEPWEPNLTLLERNIARSRDRVVLIRGAVVPSGWASSTIPLYVSRSEVTHSTVQFKGRDHAVLVPAHPIDRLVSDHGCTAIKMDIEGSEYEVLRDWEIPSSVRSVAIELHLKRKAWRREESRHLMEHLSQLGFRATREPRCSPKAWGVVGVWRRW